MDNISYYKLQAKNLFRDIKLEFQQDDKEYVVASRFFDVNVIATDFNVEFENFSLMKAQHLIAKMAGFNSWDDLIKAPEDLLEQRKLILNTYQIIRKKIYRIDLSSFERITPVGKLGDYVIKCPHLPEFEEIITQRPDCMFLSCPVNIKKWSADTKHIYVNVYPNNSTIRVLVPGKGDMDWYAVSVKNI